MASPRAAAKVRGARRIPEDEEPGQSALELLIELVSRGPNARHHDGVYSSDLLLCAVLNVEERCGAQSEAGHHAHGIKPDIPAA